MYTLYFHFLFQIWSLLAPANQDDWETMNVLERNVAATNPPVLRPFIKSKNVKHMVRKKGNRIITARGIHLVGTMNVCKI